MFAFGEACMLRACIGIIAQKDVLILKTEEGIATTIGLLGV